MKTTENLQKYSEFEKDMEELHTVTRDHCGGDAILETITDWFYDWKTDKYTFDKRGMYYLLYDIVNYDLVSLWGCEINVESSNVPEAAVILKKYASKADIDMVYENLYRM